MTSIDVIIARTFLEHCPVGWGIDSGYEALELREDGWYAHDEGNEFARVSLDEAAAHLLETQGFGDYAGIHDLVDRLRAGEHVNASQLDS